MQLNNGDITTKAKTQFTHQKVLFTYKLWPTPLPTNIVTPNPLHTSLPAPMYMYAHCLFRLLFLSIISTAYHLLSGSRAARLLLNWLIDWTQNSKNQRIRKHCALTVVRRRQKFSPRHRLPSRRFCVLFGALMRCLRFFFHRFLLCESFVGQAALKTHLFLNWVVPGPFSF